MSDLHQCSREFLVEFIELYKSFPCLWRIKSKEYSDRDKKNEAYEALIQKYKEVDTAANRETIAKKINSLRSVYRKELAKVNKSVHSGTGEDEVYKPALWYFELFDFLSDQETPRESTSTMDDDSEEIGQENDADQSDIDVEGIRTPDTPSTSTSGRVPSSSCNSSRPQSASRKRKVSPDEEKTMEVMTLVGNRLGSLKADDSFDIFGKHVANKLRSVNTQQNMFAQKLINDVLFEAEMESLSRSFKVANSAETQYQFPSRDHYAYGWQQNIPPQTAEYRPVSQQQIPQGRSITPSQASRSGDDNSPLVDYYTNFSGNSRNFQF